MDDLPPSSLQAQDLMRVRVHKRENSEKDERDNIFSADCVWAPTHNLCETGTVLSVLLTYLDPVAYI